MTIYLQKFPPPNDSLKRYPVYRFMINYRPRRSNLLLFMEVGNMSILAHPLNQVGMKLETDYVLLLLRRNYSMYRVR